MLKKASNLNRGAGIVKSHMHPRTYSFSMDAPDIHKGRPCLSALAFYYCLLLNVCYFNAEEIFSCSGRNGRKELGPILLFNPLCSPTALFCTALQGKSHLCIPFWELRGLTPNFHIYVSVSDLYIPRIGPHISLQQNGRPVLEIYKSLTDK